MFNELLILIILLLASAVLSASEIAFIVTNKIKIELRARKKYFLALNAKYFVDNPNIFFSTILISHNLINITFASLSYILLNELFGFNWVLTLFISSMFLLIIGELVPKYLGKELADSLILFSAIPVRIISFIIYPFAKLTSSVSSVLAEQALKKMIQNKFRKRMICKTCLKKAQKQARWMKHNLI